MNSYKIVKPDNYTKEHIEYIHQFKNAASLLATQVELMLIVKDVNSTFIMGSDLSATKFGLKSGNDFIGKLVSDLPCESVARYANQITQHEQQLINTCDINKSIEILNVFEFSDGLNVRVATKQLFYHQSSASILGVSSSATDMKLSDFIKLGDFINFVPSYIMRFGVIGTIEPITSNTIIDNKYTLDEDEQEMCFLFLLGWGFQQIADFMNVHRPGNIYITLDTITNKKNYICHKLQLPTNNFKSLCEYLFSIDMHHKMPVSFYSKMIGVKNLVK